MAADKKGLEEKTRGIAAELKKKNCFAIVHHYDADGICSAAIMARALQAEGKRCNCKAVKQLYKETIEEIKGLGDNYLFVDFGSGQLEHLKEAFGESFFVIDHHQPQKIEHQLQLNPFLFGFDASNETSGASLCYLVAKAMKLENKRLASLAIVGSVGDMLDWQGKMLGLNSEILQEAVEAGVIKKEIDLRLYGRISRPLVQFLMFSSNPILPELTANEENCVRFLQELKIELKQGDNWCSYEDLSQAEKKRLASELIVHLSRFDTPEWKIKELIGETYTLLEEAPKSPLRDAKEFATLLNSCGRHNRADLALAVAMGDRGEAYKEALGMLVEHRRQLKEGIDFIHEKGIEEFEGFYFFDAGEKIKESIVGIIAGMLYGSGAIMPNKPIIAAARNPDGTVKISGRANQELVRRGLNLGKAFKEICAEIGGKAEGGGHRVAAGLKIDAEQLEEFKAKLGEKIKEQLGQH